MKDPILQLIVWSVLLFLAISLVVFAGIFVGIPFVIIAIVYFVFQSVNKPKAMSTIDLFKQIDSLPKAPKTDDFLSTFIDRILDAGDLPVWPITRAMTVIADSIYEAEELGQMPPLTFPSGSIEDGRYRDQLMEHQKKMANVTDTVKQIGDVLYTTYDIFKGHLPALAKDIRYVPSDSPDPPTTVPLIAILPDIPGVVTDIMLPFSKESVSSKGLFKELRKQLLENDEVAGGFPKDYKGSSRDLVRAYLKGTPFLELFKAEVPFEIPTARFLEHAVLIAGSGHGKTQTLGALIARFIEEQDPPAMVVIDSTGALVKKVQTLAVFNDRLRDRIVIIDPEHDPPPALNMFDVSYPRMQSYSASERAAVETEIVQLFNYIFTSAQNDLTSRQGTVFSYVVRLVLSMPGSTIDTLRQVLEDDPKGGYANSRYRPMIEKLDETAQDFFKNRYFELKGFREQIAQRVYGLVQVPAFQRMFAANNKVDFFDELQNRGSIIVVNTSESLLKHEASTLFGRYVIARTMAAAFERAGIPQEARKPTFLIVDEAAPYFDDTFDKLLTRVRQFKLGVCVAFQHMEQASEKLRSSIASNTSVKLAGGLGYADSRWLARDMETTPEFLKAQRRDSADPPQWTQLACYVRNLTPQAVSLTVPFYVLENMPQMTWAEHRALLERNSARVSAPAGDSNPSPPQEPASDVLQSSPPQPAAAEMKAPPAVPASKERTRDDDAASDWR